MSRVTQQCSQARRCTSAGTPAQAGRTHVLILVQERAVYKCVPVCAWGHFLTDIFKYSIIKTSRHHSTVSPTHACTHTFMLGVHAFKPLPKLCVQRMGVKVGACSAGRTQGSPYHLLPWGKTRLEPLHSSSLSLERLKNSPPPRTLNKCSGCSLPM